jgi:hypothetical protein
VIFVAHEDSIAHIVRPSIDAQDGDPEKIVIFRLETSDKHEIYPDLGQHISELREEILEHQDTQLVVIDPPTSYLGDDIDENKTHK